MSGWKAVSVEEEAVGRELSSPEKVAVVGKAAGEEADERSVAYVAEVIEYEVEEDDMGHTGMERQHWSTGGCKVAEDSSFWILTEKIGVSQKYWDFHQQEQSRFMIQERKL
jgi:hypothetical protein